MDVPIELIELLAQMTNALEHNTPIKPGCNYAQQLRDVLVAHDCIKWTGQYYVAVIDEEDDA